MKNHQKKSEEKKPNWMTNGAMISRYFSSFGNPLDLPIDLFLLLSDRITYVRQLENGISSDREFVEFMADFQGLED
tara:strand:- start:1223 stop:1450 length:228 start_codon:yes stop_codon:yes gene_type:complete